MKDKIENKKVKKHEQKILLFKTKKKKIRNRFDYSDNSNDKNRI